MSEKQKNSSKQTSQEAVWLKWAGIALAVIEIIAGITLVGMMFWLNFLPIKFEIIVIVVLLLVSALILYSQFVRPIWAKWVGRVVSLLLSIVMIVGSVYIYQAKSTMGAIYSNEKTDVISVYVLKTDSANNLTDAKDYLFGYHSMLDIENVTNYIDSINKDLGVKIKTQSYNDLTEMVQALYDKKIGAMILNQSYASTLSEQFPDFESMTKIIATESYRTTINKPNITKNTLTDTFTIYLSGNDECGSLNSVGRSDVNILIVVNPETKQILLINTPRDYYVEVHSLTSGVQMDKLTHAGWFGVAGSMKTLSALYNNWEVDYYVRLNFTSVESIIDSLGGITINSEIEFTTHPDTCDETIHFTIGENYCNGKRALAYCRERQNIPGGDNQRGLNQMTVIQGLVNKVASPSILYNYTSVLESVKSLIQTNLSDDDIASMVKLTMESANGWNVQTYGVQPSGSTYGNSAFFGTQNMYVSLPDMSTVSMAVDLMNKIKNDEVFDLDEYIKDAKPAQIIQSTRPTTSTSATKKPQATEAESEREDIIEENVTEIQTEAAEQTESEVHTEPQTQEPSTSAEQPTNVQPTPTQPQTASQPQSATAATQASSGVQVQ